MEGWARFEQRARERRAEKRLAAAQEALRAGRFAECRAALAELGELNPAHPDLARLTLQLTRAETSRRPPGRAFAVAAAAFAVVMLAASWVGNSKLLQAPPTVATAVPPTVPETPLAASEIVVDVPIATAGEPETPLADVVAEPPAALTAGPGTSMVLAPPVVTPAVPTPPISAPPVRATESSVPVPAAVPTELGLPASSAIEPTAIPPAPSPQRVASAPPALATTPTPAAPAPMDVAPAVVDDAARVRAVVEKYQTAYDRLDAGLVHDVWPGVNEAALARAFEGLQSQTLTFRACDIQLRGSAATVLCTGSTRYVPKVGSREPRVEPLAWTFTLRKRANDEWQIESARAER
jgi:hypothetical protein